MSFRNKEIECLDRIELEKLQSKKLVKQVQRTYDNVPLFRKRMDEIGLKPSDIKGLEDLTKLPFCQKQDLRDEYPYGLFAVPLNEIVRIHGSSGTTGKRIIAGYTKKDLEDWSECVARSLSAAGLGKDDIIQVCYGYGLFTGGLGAHDGASKIGATVIPGSTGNTMLQINLLTDLKSTALCCTPSYAMYLAEAINEAGLRDKLNLKSLILGAEPWTPEMRNEIEKATGAKAYDIYGLTEIMGPGVAYECEHQLGAHINEDMFIVEVIDPNTCEPLKDGEVGELVFTTLNKEGMPLIRFRTHDLCSITKEKCKCGRTFARLGKIKGRTDDMMIIRGVNVFPSQIEETLLKFSDIVSPNYMIFLDRKNNTDTFDIQVEVKSEDLFNNEYIMAETVKKIKSSLRSMLGIGANIHLVPPHALARSEGKAKRVIDNRKLL